MEDNPSTPSVLDGSVHSIKFSIATAEDIRRYSINECPISHPSQLANPFLGLPLESSRCESCGTAEVGNCEGHFGRIELPVAVYHPSHINELRDILSLICLKCMRMKKVKQGAGKEKVSSTSCLFCRDLPCIFIKAKTMDGAVSLELSVSSKTRMRDGFWNFLERFGFHYGEGFCRPLLPQEALNILKQIPEETKRRLAGKGYFPQSGFIIQHLPVPPNCLSVPDISDGKCVMASDSSKALLKKVLNKVELIKRSRSGDPNFESHEIESNDLQSAILQYINLRGTGKAPHDIKRRFVFSSESSDVSTKQWLEKMRTLFIRKGSGFSSRCVITGDPYIEVNTVGLPSDIAKRITFEERVTQHNISHLQKIFDDRLCITYKDGLSTYAISLGSRGRTSLKVGQVVNRQIVDGDIVFINRPPSTHKHSLQAFRVFIHDEHVVRINPLICSPLGADFDGDCVHIFYPQSLSAKAEVVELFSVERQLLSSHSGNLNLQLLHDSLLALKLISNASLLRKTVAQQLAMFVSPMLPPPAIIKANQHGPFWTIIQILQNVLPALLNSSGEYYCIRQSEILKLDSNRDIVQALLTDIPTSIYQTKGPKEALDFFNCIQPLLMEVLFMEGFSVSLKDFDVPKSVIEDIQGNIQDSIGDQLRSEYNELMQFQVENHLKSLKIPIVDFVLKSSALGCLIDSKSESSIVKVVEQLGFLGFQLYDHGKYYSSHLFEDCCINFVSKNSYGELYHSSEAYGLVKNSFFHGLTPYENLIHSIASREVMVRSSRGLTEPGTLFKNLMAFLRDVVVCYDATVRNICTGSIVQFKYTDNEVDSSSTPAGEPVGVLAATAISNPAYKAVLDSSQSNNSSWELMKEILLCKISYKNDISDRRVTLYLKDCCCPRRFCKEKAAQIVLNSLKKVSLKDCACDFSIEYRKQIHLPKSSMMTSGLVGHIHLDKMQLKMLNKCTDDILRKCQDFVLSYSKKKGQLSHLIKRVLLSACERCSTHQESNGDLNHVPCLQFSYSDASAAQNVESLESVIHLMANVICPILLDTVIKGDPRVFDAKIVWIGSDATSWVRNSEKTLKGELGVEIVVAKDAVLGVSDAWRIVMDACLPVIHLVDTSRSVPYGIQEIQDLLGISCAFDQTVQRLARAIRMVAKNMMKEHLHLVASSMTCTGGLIGFNTSGFKALLNSFKVRVPFTAATLYTPMKCFEKAAEKCYTDSLASVVSSCSWGKKVAIGSGAPFQILWDKKQMEINKDISKGVYDFLELLRPTSYGVETGACLADVDDLPTENGSDELCFSPAPDGILTFEQNLDLECSFQKNTSLQNRSIGKSVWEVASDSGIKSDDWQCWGSGKPTATKSANSCPSDESDVWGKQRDGTRRDEKEMPSFCKHQSPDTHNQVQPSDESDAWGQWKSVGNAAGWESENQDGKFSNSDAWSEKLEENQMDDQEKETFRKISADTIDRSCLLNETNEWGNTAPRELESQDGKLNVRSNLGGKANINRLDEKERPSSWKKKGSWGPKGKSGQDASCSQKGWNSNRAPASRRRVESLTTEEEKIRAEVEPILQTIKRILRDSSDGDRLSADDQRFVLDNVFEYHPSKQSKVSNEVDHVVVNKHNQFQGTRCFFLVSEDGTSIDFSYVKCMINFIRKTYPEHGESFIKKYFNQRHTDRADDSRASTPLLQ